jgi:ribulose-phosphate 3-epimerase
MKIERNAFVAPSMLSADFARVEEEVLGLKANGIKYLHLDIMDGSFVPTITFGHKFVSDVRHHQDLIFDTHLMVVNPEKHITNYAKAGSDIITVHAEAALHLHSTLKAIHEEGKKSGISIVPTTPLSSIEIALEMVDLVLLMSVDPGFGGQSFIPWSLKKISDLAEMRKKYNLDFMISVDGGVNENNVVDIVNAGADLLVMGNGYFNATDRKALVKLVQG